MGCEVNIEKVDKGILLTRFGSHIWFFVAIVAVQFGGTCEASSGSIRFCNTSYEQQTREDLAFQTDELDFLILVQRLARSYADLRIEKRDHLGCLSRFKSPSLKSYYLFLGRFEKKSVNEYIKAYYVGVDDAGMVRYIDFAHQYSNP
jgi:hypothetical protein